MQIQKKNKQKYIYKYIVHVFSLGHMPRNVWQSSHVLAGISMCFSFFKFSFLRFFSLCGWLPVTYVLIQRHYEAKFAG